MTTKKYLPTKLSANDMEIKLGELFPGFDFQTVNGQIVIYTNLAVDEDTGLLIEYDPADHPNDNEKY